MPTFAYIALDAEGRRHKGLMEADDPRSARQVLSGRGLYAERVDPLGSSATAREGGLRQDARRALVYRELSALVRAGITLERGLLMIGAMPEMTRCRREMAGACDRIREGAGPAEAMATAFRMGPLELAALTAGERSGTIDGALERLADTLDARVRARARLVSALIYPALVGLLGTGVAIAMLGFMLPSFLRVWTEAGIELPWITRAVSSAGRWAGMAFLPAALLAVLVGTVPPLRRTAARMGRRLRFAVGRSGAGYRLLQAQAASRFARTLALLLRGGVPAVDALPLAGRATGRPDIAEAVDRLAGDVRHGLALAAALRRVPILADPLAPWVEAGEAAGDLAGMLERAADREHEAWERALERWMSVVEPVLILLLGALVLLIALAILMPVLSLHRGLG